MSVLGLIGILLGIAILMYFTFQRMDVVWLAVIAALVVALFNGVLSLEVYTETFMSQAGSFFKTYTPIFLVGCVFAALFSASGAAQVISKGIIQTFAKGGANGFRGIVVAVISCFCLSIIFTLGGIDGMASIIAKFPLVLGFFKQVNIPRKYVPGCIYIGAVMSAFPSSPQIINVIPMSLGTTPTAAAIPGIIGSVVGGLTAIIFTIVVLRKAQLAGQGFVGSPSDPVADESKKTPNFFVSLIPLVAIFLVFNLAHLNIVLSMTIGIVLCLILFAPYLKAQHKENSYKKMVIESVNSAVPQVAYIAIVTSSLTGFGAVVSATPTFSTIVSKLSAAASNNTYGLFVLVIAAAIVVAIMANPVGGVSTAVNVLAKPFLAAGVPAEAFHRIVTMCGTTFDSLPTNAGVIMAVKMPGCSMKEGYPLLGWNSVVCTLISTFVTAAVMTVCPGLI